jgi:hypothetical protein
MSSGNSGKTERLIYETAEIDLFCDMTVGIGGDKWPAADQFCKVISQPKSFEFFSKLFNNARCIELGAGTGVVSILIEKIFNPKELIITDLQDHIEHIEKNISINNSLLCKSLCYDWTIHQDIGTFDIILAFEWYIYI